MACAAIAGLPVEVGLYTALIPMLAYVALGTSRTLSVSTTSTIAILVAAEIAAIAPNADAATKMHIAATLALLVGAFLLVAGVLRLGFVADFISDPVLTGFKAGIGFVIIVDQVPKLLGLHVDKAGFFRDIISIVTHLPQAALPTALIGMAALAFLIGSERFFPRLPSSLIVVTLGIIASAAFGLSHIGVTLLGAIPAGLPWLAAPNLSFAGALWPGALGIALMSFTESIAAGRAFPVSHERPEPNRELLALGAANLGGSFFHIMPAGGGTSQTAANSQAGARSQVAQLVTFAAVVATLLFLSPLIALVPLATLAAVIIAASVTMINRRAFRALWEFRATEFAWSIAALLGVMLLGTLNGIVVAVALSILTLVYYANHPPLYALGRKPGTDAFRPLSAEHPEDETFPGLLILQTEGAMTFASAPRLRDKATDLIAGSSPRVIVFDLSAVPIVEYTALKLLTEFEANQRTRGSSVWLAGLTPGVLETIRRAPLGKTLGHDRLFFNVELAVEAYQSRYLERSSQP
jgi:SulP family sulfate permease